MGKCRIRCADTQLKTDPRRGLALGTALGRTLPALGRRLALAPAVRSRLRHRLFWLLIIRFNNFNFTDESKSGILTY